MHKRIVAPSLLAADFSQLGKEIEIVNQSEAEWLHIDVMDGVFVPNISFGTPVLEVVQQHNKKVTDVHLMIEKPERYISMFKTLGADILTVHAEACTHLHRTLQEIRNHNMKAGVALNPHTPVSILEYVITSLDVVCIMSVNPGFGGQSFIDTTYQKIKDVALLRKETGGNFQIEIDGGVNTNNSQSLFQAGSDVLVAGSAVFGAENPKDTIKEILHGRK